MQTTAVRIIKSKFIIKKISLLLQLGYKHEVKRKATKQELSQQAKQRVTFYFISDIGDNRWACIFSAVAFELTSFFFFPSR